ncbi:MAG: SURF1 family protein, partial [Asticcacaulis sp.]|nr:SURF1 family protein [Asticcacaulis sp.]
MPVSAFIKAAPRGLTVAVIMAFAILCGLGIWQIQRLHWKEGLIADLARTHALPPAPVDQVLATAHPEWRAVVLPPCAINPGHMLYMHSQASGQPGYRALAACPVPGGAILTDLGFVAD